MATRNLERSQADILDGAEKCFVRLGFKGASMNEIAREAGVTQSLIHYHFKNKENLWNEVKRRRLECCFRKANNDLLQPITQISQLETFIVNYFNIFRENPQFSKLIGWQNFSPTGKTQDANSPEQEIVRLGIQRIKESQEAGFLKKELDPSYLIISLFSLITSWFQSRDEYLQRKDFSLKAKTADDDYLETMVKIFLKGALTN